MNLKMRSLFYFSVIALVLFFGVTDVYAIDIEGYKEKAAELKTEIAILEEDISECVNNKDLAHKAAKNARAYGFSEDSDVIVTARSVWYSNDMLQKELTSKLSALQATLDEYEMYANMTYVGNFKLTGYCACRSCCGKSPSNPAYGITAMGTRATEGRTIAMDKRFAFGTKVYIEGLGVRTVEDRGGAIKGNRIDVYSNTHAGCYAPEFNTTAKVYIIKA